MSTLLADRWTKVTSIVLVIALLVVLAIALLVRGRENTGTAYFAQTVNLYPGDEVRVLGVQIGEITAIQPERDQVRVDFSYDADTPIPADVAAAIVSPSLVGVRFVQLSPAYEGGATLPGGAVIPIGRTVSPAEWDEVKQQVLDLATALGPHANQTAGALDRLLETTSANLDGQGPAIRQTLGNLSRAVTTLSDGRQDLFATIRNLQVFIAAIQDADAQVARFQSQLARVSNVLDENRENLGRALNTITTELPLIEGFIRDNRERLTTDVQKLTQITSALMTQRQSLADVLQRAPATVSNFSNMVDEHSGSVTVALAPTNLRDPAAFICDAAASAAPGGATSPDAGNACRAGLGPLLDLARTDLSGIGVNPLNRNGTDASGIPILPGGNR